MSNNEKTIIDVINVNQWPNVSRNWKGYVILIYEDKTCEMILEYDARESFVTISGLKNKLIHKKDFTREDIIKELFSAKSKMIKPRK